MQTRLLESQRSDEELSKSLATIKTKEQCEQSKVLLALDLWFLNGTKGQALCKRPMCADGASGRCAQAADVRCKRPMCADDQDLMPTVLDGAYSDEKTEPQGWRRDRKRLGA